MTGIRVLSTGKALPKHKVTNNDLAAIVETSDEWIEKRTGMKVRGYCDESEGTTSLAKAAAMEAMEKSGLGPEDIGVLVVATLSPDNFTPSTACLLQKELGLSTEIIAMDINAACSGFVFGLETVRGLLLSTGAKAAILVGVETLSRKLDMTDRGTCVLFGDGAAAAVITLADSLFAVKTGVESDFDMIHCTREEGLIRMDGHGTYRFAVSKVPALINAAVEKAGLTLDEIDHFVLHQANLRIIESVGAKLNQPMAKFVVNIDKYGNTSAASVGLALADENEAGGFKQGDKILLCAFGAGKTYGAAVFEW